jgi:energy-coupling factor transporter ATP-binding protein EcfA2
MKLVHVHIVNYRSCRDIALEIDSMHALVGSNNAGKSSVLRALDFLFNPSTRTLNAESFWSGDTTLEIRVEAVFSDLTAAERTTLGSYLKPDGNFHIARTARMDASSPEPGGSTPEDKSEVEISQLYKKPVPEREWIQDSSISGSKIKEWWTAKEGLKIGDLDFGAFLGGNKPTVGEWKTKAAEFVAQHEGSIPMTDSWIDNPTGYANVLKGILPLFVLVPAVRDVADETKGAKTSPFGRLLSAIVGTVGAEKKTEIATALAEVAKHMNRSGGDKRVPLIAETERKLNELLKDFFDGCDVEIEFETPTIEILMSTPRLIVDDGFRNAVENKGHGLQRAVIFTILRRYADYMTEGEGGRRRGLILAVEEPEIYMHPQAQRTIRRVFRKLAGSGDQVLFSTHSSLLIDVAYFDEIIRLECRSEEVNGRKTNVSTAWQLPMSKMIADICARHTNLRGSVSPDSMRERYAHAYNPRRSEGFFASKVILVEGLTEEYSLPVYADALPNCDFDPHGVSVVECGGKGLMDRLYRIFNELHIACYLLFDYDMGNTNRAVIDKSEELLALAGGPTGPPHTLVVTDKVACFPKKWEVDVGSEIADIGQLTADAKRKLGLSDDSGKPLVARFVARKLTSRTPPCVPPSLRMIIEKAVKVRWSASCLQT